MASSTNNDILNGHELTSDSWKYAEPKVNNSCGKNIGLRNAATNKKLYLATPLMLTWGVNENDFEGKGNVSYDMSLQFPREQDSNYNLHYKPKGGKCNDEGRCIPNNNNHSKIIYGKQLTIN